MPLAQSAYQSGRSTTEQVFAIKVVAEKAITSSTYNIYLLLLDMSKAFDTVCRSKLLTDLQKVLEPDEMHMMAVLIGDVVLTVKVGKELGEQIKTDVGIAQDDCLSAVGETGASCYNFHSKSLFHKNMQARDFFWTWSCNIMSLWSQVRGISTYAM